jgi:hypothetical protein
VLKNYKGIEFWVFIDDIFFGRTTKEHTEMLVNVLDRFRKVPTRKMHLLRDQFNYLGRPRRS